MPDTPENPAPPPAAPLLPFDALVACLADPVRWRILRELATGRPLMVVELAEKLGLNPGSTSKHLAYFRRAGLIANARNRLNLLRPDLLPDLATRTLDLGYCTLHLDAIP